MWDLDTIKFHILYCELSHSNFAFPAIFLPVVLFIYFVQTFNQNYYFFSQNYMQHIVRLFQSGVLASIREFYTCKFSSWYRKEL